MSGVFINYRAGDGHACARLLDEKLSSRIGSHNVFQATRSVDPGDDFPAEIEAALSECDVVIAIVGPRWRSDRTWEESDWVRRELAGAVRRDIPIIPVLIDDAVRLTADELPDEIKPLAARHHYLLRFNVEHDLTELIDKVLEHAPALGAEEAAHRLIVSLDFRGRPEPGEAELATVRERVYRTVRNAFAEIGLATTRYRMADRDPEELLIVIPADVPRQSIVGAWIRQVCAGLGDGTQIRIGVHSGQVQLDQGRPSGMDVELARTLSTSRVAGKLARAAHDAAAVVIVSDRVYQTIVVAGGRFIERAAYRPVTVADSPAWARIPGWSTPPALLEEDEPEGRATTDPDNGHKIINITGNATVIDTYHGRDLNLGPVNYGKESR